MAVGHEPHDEEHAGEKPFPSSHPSAAEEGVGQRRPREAGGRGAPRMWASALVLAGLLAAAAHGSGGWGGGSVALRGLDTSSLPRYTPAALALSSRVGAGREGMSGKDKATLGKMADKAHGDHALGGKALKKIMAAARAAAMHSNGLIRAADDALMESQKALGTNAVHLKLLTGGDTAPSSGGGPLSSSDLAALIEHSRKDSDAKKALAQASAAAARNKKLMDGARDILRDSARALGRDAVALPALSGGARAGAGDARAERRFVHATRLARKFL